MKPEMDLSNILPQPKEIGSAVDSRVNRGFLHARLIVQGAAFASIGRIVNVITGRCR